MKTPTATIAGFAFTPREFSDSFDKAIARHEIPHRDLPLIEDMGLKGRTVRIRCWFSGPRYETHFSFVEALKERGPVSLMHPNYGLLTGAIEQVDVRHDRRRQTAEVDITFVQGVLEEDDVLAYDVQGAIEEAYIAGIKEQRDALADGAFDALGPVGKDIVQKTIDSGQGILEQLTGYTGAAREWVKTVDTAVTAMEAALSEVTNPANTLIATIDFAANLPGRVVGAAAKVAERYAELYSSVKHAPARFGQSLHYGMARLEAALDLDVSSSQTGGNALEQAGTAAKETVRKCVLAVGAQTAALQAAYAYADDEERRNTSRKLEQTRAFGTGGEYLSPPSPPELLTVREIEASLATVRSYLQEAVDEARTEASVRSLKQMAHELLRHVNTVKLEKEKLKAVEVSPPMPIHMVCLRHGLPYSYAPRILAVNPGISKPNAVSGEVLVYAK